MFFFFRHSITHFKFQRMFTNTRKLCRVHLFHKQHCLFFIYQHLPLFTKITILLGSEKKKKSKPSEDEEQKNALGRDASGEI